jgi:hypothetical protein
MWDCKITKVLWRARSFVCRVRGMTCSWDDALEAEVME